MAHRRRRSPRPLGRSQHRYQRTDRVAQVVREIVAEQLSYIDDVVVEGLVITGVDVDRELTNATVHFDMREPELAPEALSCLEANRPQLQRALSDGVRMRRTPVLRFAHDTSLIEADRIDRLLAADKARRSGEH